MIKLFISLLLVLTLSTQARALSAIYTACESSRDLTTLIDDLPTLKTMNIDVIIPYSHFGGNAWIDDAGYASAMNTLMTAASSANLKILIDVTRYTQYEESFWGGIRNIPNISGLTTLINGVKSNAGLYGYYLADEPARTNVAAQADNVTLQSVYNSIIALDSSHQIYNVQFSPLGTSSVPFSGQDWYVTTDHTMYGIDNYPLMFWRPSSPYTLDSVVYPVKNIFGVTAGDSGTSTPVAVITSSAHGFSTGTQVSINGVGGIIGANGAYTITVVDSTHFTLNNNYSTGTYTSGGIAAGKVSYGYKATGFATQTASSSGTQPTWPTCPTASMVVDGGITWQCVETGIANTPLQSMLTSDVNTINGIIGSTTDKLSFVMQAFQDMNSGFLLPSTTELADMAAAGKSAGATRNGITFFIWNWGTHLGNTGAIGIKDRLSDWKATISTIAAQYQEYLPPAAIIGVCGTSNGATVTIAPTTNLCATGTATVVTGTGPWGWSCAGSNGGTTEVCSANIQTYLLSLTFTCSGGGSVSGDISCLKGVTCQPVSITVNSPINLIPLPDINSLFMGWSGACSNTINNCQITMNSDKSVNAAFTLAPKIKLDVNSATGYDTLVDAYNNATSTIFAMDTVLTGDWTLDGNKNIELIGGYQADYKGRIGITILNGKLTIKGGSLRAYGLAIGPAPNSLPITNAGNNQNVNTGSGL